MSTFQSHPKTSKQAFPAFENVQKQIRLLTFQHKPERSTKLCLVSQPYHLDALTASYIALSYPWGADEGTDVIDLNGVERAIGKNLSQALESLQHQALQQRRSQTHSTTDDQDDLGPNEPWDFMWIDALCIDQEDYEEKKHQVQLMARIYKSAQQTVVWPAPDCGPSFKLIVAASENSGEKVITDLSQLIRYRGKDIYPFAESPYWSRLWVLQEFLLAKSILFISGRDRMSFGPLLSIYERISELNLLRLRVGDATVRPFLNMLQRRQQSNDSGKFISIVELEPLLYHAIDLKCKDPRDRIYGLLGLVDWTLTPGIRPLSADYEVEHEELVHRTLELTINAGLDPCGKDFADLAHHFYVEWKCSAKSEWLRSNQELARLKRAYDDLCTREGI